MTDKKERIIKYLEWVIETYGPDKHILQTNCNGNPQASGDYSIDHGKAGELLKQANEGTLPSIPV